MPPPQNLSSSVSMFIEDSRIAAVANASVNPVNPSNFYTISAVRYSPNITPIRSLESISPDRIIRPSSLVLPGISSQNVGQGHNMDMGVSPVESNRKPREIFHKIRREDDGDEAVSGFLSASSGSPCSAIGGHVRKIATESIEQEPSRERRRVSASLKPSAPWLHIQATSNKYFNTSGGVCSQRPHSTIIIDSDSGVKCGREGRAFTSVNLTLKSPTSSVAGSITQQLSDSSCNYRCSTEIISPGSTSSSNNFFSVPLPGPALQNKCCDSHNPRGNAVTYSTYSNSRDGFESQLQIQIGPNGGKISASRRRNSNEGSRSNKSSLSHVNAVAMQQKMNEELIVAQRERKNKLETVLGSQKIRLAQLRSQVLTLRSRLQLQHSPELERLRGENKKLMMECEYMTEQVDMYNNGSIPLGETSEEFYRDIYPGQDANALVRNSSERGRWPRGRGKPPPRPPPPRILALPRQNETQSGEWCCSMCTFRNHPDLSQCEQCQMVRVQPSVTSPGAISGMYR